MERVLDSSNLYLHLTPFRQLNSADPEEFGIAPEIVTAWQEAVKSKSRNAKNAIFTAFLNSGKQWGQLLSFIYQL